MIIAHAKQIFKVCPTKKRPNFSRYENNVQQVQIIGCILVKNRHHWILKYITFDYIYKRNLLYITDLLLINISIFSNILLWCLLNSYSYVANQVIDGQDWRYVLARDRNDQKHNGFVDICSKTLVFLSLFWFNTTLLEVRHRNC